MKKSLLISAVFCGFFMANVSVCPEVIAVSSTEQEKVEDPYSSYNIYLSHKLNEAFFKTLLQYYKTLAQNTVSGQGNEEEKYGSAHSDNLNGTVPGQDDHGSAHLDKLSKRSQEEIDKIGKIKDEGLIIDTRDDIKGFLACQEFINRGNLVRKEVSDGKYYELDFSLSNIEDWVTNQGKSDIITEVDAYTDEQLVDAVLEISDRRFADELSNIEKCIKVVKKFKELQKVREVLEKDNNFEDPSTVLSALLEIVNELKKSAGSLGEVLKMVEEFQKISQEGTEVSKKEILQKVLEEVEKSKGTNEKLQTALQNLQTAKENKEGVLADVLVDVLVDEDLQAVLALLEDKGVKEWMDDSYLCYDCSTSEWEKVDIGLRCYYGFINHIGWMRLRLISDNDLESFKTEFESFKTEFESFKTEIDRADKFANAVSSGDDIKEYTVKSENWEDLSSFLTKIQESLQDLQEKSSKYLQQYLVDELNKSVGEWNVLKCILKKLAIAQKLRLLDSRIDLTINPNAKETVGGSGAVILKCVNVIDLCHELAHNVHMAFLGRFVTPTLIVKGQEKVPVKVPNIRKIEKSDFKSNKTWEDPDDLLTITGRSYAFCLPKTDTDSKPDAKPELKGVLIIDNECENMARHLAGRPYRTNHNSSEVANKDEKMHAFYDKYANTDKEETREREKSTVDC